jgi:glycosyltransferase involved in cell wall biosynthesis
MTIAFIHAHKSFLPGLGAYLRFFAARGIKTEVCFPHQAKLIQADLEWHFMGSQIRKNPQALTIHEYGSASTPPLRRVKDRLKKLINCRPDFRIFDSAYAQQQFGFSDQVPSAIRQSGLFADALSTAFEAMEKKYDFIYVGTVAPERRMSALFTLFRSGRLRNQSLLILSQNYAYWQAKCRDSANIHFQGPVPWDQVYSYVRKARYAINFVPDIPPFSHQPSSKFLDYVACRVPVITTDYAWVREFQGSYGGRFYYLTPDLRNWDWESVLRYDFAFPDLKEWTWENQITRSGILEFLRSKGLEA